MIAEEAVEMIASALVEAERRKQSGEHTPANYPPDPARKRKAVDVMRSLTGRKGSNLAREILAREGLSLTVDGIDILARYGQ